MPHNHNYSHITQHFAQQHVVTVATGTTCAYLGDERGLREHLVADEAIRRLRQAGHTAISFLIDDNLDPLNFRQLRVALNKDEKLIERYEPWCGRPIAYLPDPWGCCESYAAHFETLLLNRLHYADCHPTLIRISKAYERGLYASAVRRVLEDPQEIREFLKQQFPQYTPEKLFWPICPQCEYIDAAHVERVQGNDVSIHCHRCEQTSTRPLDEVAGKLNWKIDCAVRWTLFNIDAEAFNKSHMEPQAGSFAIAQALSQRFFGGHAVFPLHYGTVKMENKFGGKLLDSLPPTLLRRLFVDQPNTDIKLTRDFVVTSASRHEVLPELTYIDFVKQVLPLWLLTPDSLTWPQRELVKHGVAFGKDFLQTQIRPHLPQRQYIEGEDHAVLSGLHELLQKTIEVRISGTDGAEIQLSKIHISHDSRTSPGDHQDNVETTASLQEQLQEIVNGLGPKKSAILKRLRTIVGQEQGLPATKLLLLLSLDYMNLLSLLIELFLKCSPAASDSPMPQRHKTDSVKVKRDKPNTDRLTVNKVKPIQEGIAA